MSSCTARFVLVTKIKHIYFIKTDAQNKYKYFGTDYCTVHAQYPELTKQELTVITTVYIKGLAFSYIKIIV